MGMSGYHDLLSRHDLTERGGLETLRGPFATDGLFQPEPSGLCPMRLNRVLPRWFVRSFLTVLLGLSACRLLPAATLDEALDTFGAGWSTDVSGFGVPATGGEWVGQFATTHDGTDAAMSGPLPDYYTSRLRATFTGPGTLTYWVRHDVGDGQNPLSIKADGNWVSPFIPGGIWMPHAIELPSRPVTIEWSWYNGLPVAWPDSHAYVDQVTLMNSTGAANFFGNLPDVIVGDDTTFQPQIAVVGAKPMRLELTQPGGSVVTTDLPAVGANDPASFSGWSYGFQATPALAGVWTITASNVFGAVSRTFQVTVTNTPPREVAISGPTQAWAGANVVLSAQSRGSQPRQFQWRKDGQDLPGQTGETLTLNSFSAADVGEYTVRVTNAGGQALSFPLTIALGNQAPGFAAQPTDMDLALYDSAALNYEVSGTPPFGMKLWKNGQVVAEDPAMITQGFNYYLYGDATSAPGVYWVTVTNGLGGAASSRAIVQVGEGVGIAEGLDNRSVGWQYDLIFPPGWIKTTTSSHDGTDAVGIVGQSPTALRTSIEGPVTIAFWWRAVDGVLAFQVDGQSSRQLTAPGADSAWQKVQVDLPAGWHQLVWLNDWNGGGVTAEAYLDQFNVVSQNSAPTFATQPAGADRSSGDSVDLIATVTGTPPYTYRLYREDNSLAGTVTDSPDPQVIFSLNSLSFADAGAYYLEVMNADGSTFSDDAIVSVDGNYGTLSHVAEAVGQPLSAFQYTDYSLLQNQNLNLRPWYRTHADGVPQGADTSIRTPALQPGDLAAVTTEFDGPALVRFSLRLPANVAWGDVLGFGVNGILQAPRELGTEVGASGQNWVVLEGSLPDLSGSTSSVQWEIVPNGPDFVAYLGRIELVPAVPPVIDQQPASLVAVAGQPGALTVVAHSGLPLNYQWYRVGTGLLAGATGETLSFPAVSASDAGTYYVEVSNDFGTAQSIPVTVAVTGAPPTITQGLQPQWARPNQAFTLTVTATTSNQPLQYRWLRDGNVLPGESGATLQRANASLSDAGLYRVEVFDGFYTVTSEARVVVASLLYQMTVLPPVDAGESSFAEPQSINRAGVVAGYSGNNQWYATVWQGGVPTRLTSPGNLSAGFAINDRGQVAGTISPPGAFLWGRVALWSPPYAPDVYADLGTPAGHPHIDEVYLNNAGQIAATEGSYGSFGQARFAFRYSPASQWEPLGPLVGTQPLDGAVEQGWATVLGINQAGVILGLSYFQEPKLTQVTGWFNDPRVRPSQRVAMDTLSPDLALRADQPWGWLDAANDRGDMVGRRYGAGSPTRLFAITTGGAVTKVLEVPPYPASPGLERFNMDVINNRREMVGILRAPDGELRAALIRSRTAAPGVTPADFSDFALYDLNDLVVGGTGNYLLSYATSINDMGQIVGSLSPKPGVSGGRPGFLLTPVTPYPDLPVQAVDDVLTRPTGQALDFTAAELTANDLGAAPLTVTSMAGTAAGGTIVVLGGNRYRYEPPAGPDVPDSFTYVVQSADGSSATATVRVHLATPPRPPSNAAPVQALPGGEIRVRFAGTPGKTYQIEVGPTPSGPWFVLATVTVDASGTVEYIDAPPPALVTRFYRTLEL